MAFLRSLYLNICDTEHDITGNMRFHTIEKVEDDVKDHRIELTIYRGPEHASERDWLKDVLVQVIEQL